MIVTIVHSIVMQLVNKLVHPILREIDRVESKSLSLHFTEKHIRIT